MYVLDSDVIIDVACNAPRGQSVIKLIGDTPAATTSVSVHEVLVGVVDRAKPIYDRLLEGLQVLTHDDAAARTGARLQQELKGTRLSSTDAMIAGICISQQATLVTFDKAFKRVKGLNVVEL